MVQSQKIMKLKKCNVEYKVTITNPVITNNFLKEEFSL